MDHWEYVIRQDHLALTEEKPAFCSGAWGDAEVTAMLERVVSKRLRRKVALALINETPFPDELPSISKRVNAFFSR